ncbi:aromatic compound degradation protein PaaI [Methylobacterium radiodurans]|uniref:Aromatic compound degradation protein PaaI n=1 Tax=Methylobacterium radiodurans TaxID=2202828 RepID=A0A2U8VZG5_9HYPH|nr:aromatic compound degradation protein PaaI [Methylobacterium radiodurans]
MLDDSPKTHPPSRRRTVEWDDPRTTAAAGQSLAGVDFLRALLAGEIPPPPAIQLLGIEFVSVDPGTASMRMPAAEYLFNPLGSVHGGSLATLLDSVMGCAVHSTLPVGRGYTTLEFKMNFLRPATGRSGLLTAVGQVIHAGRQQAVAEGRLSDEAGRLVATASTTCLVFDLPVTGAPVSGG